jgi:hypothetical protein
LLTWYVERCENSPIRDPEDAGMKPMGIEWGAAKAGSFGSLLGRQQNIALTLPVACRRIAETRLALMWRNKKNRYLKEPAMSRQSWLVPVVWVEGSHLPWSIGVSEDASYALNYCAESQLLLGVSNEPWQL